MIELGKTYQDKSGNSVRIICVDKKSNVENVTGIGLVMALHYEYVQLFSMDGRSYGASEHYDLILPEDYSTYVIDEPVMVRDSSDAKWKRRYFAGIREGNPCAYYNKATSWSNNGEDDIIQWLQCRRPTAEELGEK